MRGGGHQKSRLGLPALLLAGTAWASAAAAQQAVEDDAVPGLSAGDDSYLSSLYRQRSDQPGDAGLLTAPGRKSYVYEAVLSPRLTWSDNVTLASDGEGEGDALAAVYLTGGALVDRVRFVGLVSGGIKVGRYFDPPTVGVEPLYNQNVFAPDVIAGGTLKVTDNLLFVDVAAAARQQSIDESERYSGASLANNDRQADNYSVSISPYLRRTSPSESAIELRYRYIGVAINDKDSIEGVDNYLNDSTAHEVVAEYDSGRLLDRVGFVTRAYANKTEETGSDILPEVNFEQLSLSGTLRYRMNRKVSLLATVGEDDIDTKGTSPFNDDDLSGTFWKAGVELLPGRKSEARFEFGERYGGSWLDAYALYRYSSRLHFRLAGNTRLQTSAQAQVGRYGVLQSETLGFAEELRQLGNLTSSEILDRVLEYNSGLSDIGVQQAGLARSSDLFADIIAQSPRTSLVLRGGLDSSDYGYQDIDSWTLNAIAEHKLSRRLSGRLQANYRQSLVDLTDDPDVCFAGLKLDPSYFRLSDAEIADICADPAAFDEDAETLSFIAGVDYLLFRNINGFLELSRSQRFSDKAENEYLENAVTAGLEYEF